MQTAEDQFQFFEGILFETLGRDVQVNEYRLLQGGSINATVQILTSEGKYFVKYNTLNYDQMFAAEARGLDLTPEQIEVVVHPQSIIHSMVQFEDGSIKAQMGLPDMRVPIQFALSYPVRLKSDFPRFDFSKYPSLTFQQPDTQTFRNLGFAFEALRRGGNMACIVNAANEIAVASFLKDEIGFLEMSDLIEACMHKVSFVKTPTLEDYIRTDEETRRIALEY